MHTCTNNLIKIVMLVVFVISTSELQAATSAGTIKSLHGEVSIKRDDSLLKPSIGMAIVTADELITGAESSVGVVMLDNTVLTAGENSVLNLESFSYNRKSRRGSMRANVKRGSLSAISGHLAKTSPDDVRFKTATMTLGVRGTEFVIDVQDGEGSETSVVLLPDFGGGVGKVAVESNTGMTTEISEAYSEAQISPDGSISTSLLDALSIIARFCGILDAQPARPKIYLFYLDESGQGLEQTSQYMLDALASDLKFRAAPELDIVGYTDTSLGQEEADSQSQMAAERLQTIFTAKGIIDVPTTVVGRGFRDLLKQTAAGVVEAKNNRIEVILK